MPKVGRNEPCPCGSGKKYKHCHGKLPGLNRRSAECRHARQPASPRAADLHPVPGVRIGTAMAGMRKANRRDLTVFALGRRRSRRPACSPEPLLRRAGAGLPRASGAGSDIRALVINTGNANAGTGADGLARARATCAALAQLLDIAAEQVLPFSTGVIMEPLPVERIEAGLPAALADAARPTTGSTPPHAIMTTDTVPKAASRQVDDRRPARSPSPASPRAPA